MTKYERFERIEYLIQKLGAKESQYEAILDASPWGILVVDQTFHIVYINATFERMSGYNVSEISGRYIGILIPDNMKLIHVEHEKNYVKNPRNRIGNHGLKPQILTKYNSILDVEISLSPSRIEGQQLFFASIRPLDSLYNTIEGYEHGI